jgi:hypothetical protein
LEWRKSIFSTVGCKRLKFKVSGRSHEYDYHIMNLPHGIDVIVGMDFMLDNDVILLARSQTVMFGGALSCYGKPDVLASSPTLVALCDTLVLMCHRANATATDDDMPDGMIARAAVQTIRRLAEEDSPFFVAVGFLHHKPHLPLADGWHLGDNNEWAKHTAMTRANRTPLLFAAPCARPSVRHGYAELVDIYATLVDLAGITVPPRCDTKEQSQTLAVCTEGASLKPLIMPQAIVGGGDVSEKVAAFGQWSLGGHMGYNLYTNLDDGSEVRYTEWTKYNKKSHGPVWGKIAGRELYNRSADPEESDNIAEHASLNITVVRLSQRLRAGWRAVTPPRATASLPLEND